MHYIKFRNNILSNKSPTNHITQEILNKKEAVIENKELIRDFDLVFVHKITEQLSSVL